MYVIIIWNKLNLIQNTQLSVFKGEQGMNNSSWNIQPKGNIHYNDTYYSYRVN